jgi:starvation-inducible DNA-binding protein
MESVKTQNGQSEVKKKKKAFINLGFSELDTAELVSSMNMLLANYSVHYQKLRNYHWNVKGEDFFDLHEQFEKQYNYVREAIDDLAERIRVFGQTPYSTMEEFLKHSEIKENGSLTPAPDMVHDILDDYRILLGHMNRVVEIAIDNGDLGTEDLIRSFIKTTEKNHWMFTAFMKR